MSLLDTFNSALKKLEKSAAKADADAFTASLRELEHTFMSATADAAVARQRHQALLKTAELFNSEAALTLQILERAGYDLWGSSDLHFDGDCFQEHAWSCRLRGGGLAESHQHVGTGNTPFDAIMCAWEKKLADTPKNRWYKRLALDIRFYKGERKKLQAKAAAAKKAQQGKDWSEMKKALKKPGCVARKR